MNSQLTNILRNATRSGYFLTMAQKLVVRADDYLHRSDQRAVRQWCAGRATDVNTYARERDAQLWAEAEQYAEQLSTRARETLAQQGVTLGGGGHYALLYFLTRWKRPKLVLETGVAAGYSSSAILGALERNGGEGALLSSDFPYFRLKDPERYIGCLVEPHLRPRWTLETKGDRLNIPKLLERPGAIDLFHYDSDKSHYGRRWALRQVARRLAPGALVVMDDVQDNWFFREQVERTQSKFYVFEFNGKYLGLFERP